MQAQEKSVTTCLLQQLRESELIWPATVDELQPAALHVAEPRDHQLEALRAIESWAQSTETRGQVVMACGTGKSLVAIRGFRTAGSENRSRAGPDVDAAAADRGRVGAARRNTETHSAGLRRHPAVGDGGTC